MRNLFRKHKKLYISYLKTIAIAVIFLAVAIPFVNRMAEVEDFIHSPNKDSKQYMVSMNGEILGYVREEQAADKALLAARTKLNEDTDGLSLVKSELTVEETTGKNALMSEKELTKTIYRQLSSQAVNADTESVAYTVRIDDFTATLATLDEVESLFNMVKEKYVGAQNFAVELVEEDTGVYSIYRTNFISSDKSVNEVAKVLAGANGSESLNTSDITYTDGILAVDFVENIEVIATKGNIESVLSLEEAYEAITKEHAQKGTYTVEAGDCLSSIATKVGLSLDDLYRMNEGLNGDSVIYAGDVLTVTVPAAEISVEVVEEKSYTEEFSGNVRYVDNNSIYCGTENVIEQGEKGQRSVVALITSVNGKERGREIISQEVIKEPTETVIERGTLVPPTYIWPVYGTTITQYFGHNGHSGVDVYVPTGTAVRATAAGTIICAGWKGDLGNCVEIDHGNGLVTRYGHLSSVAVSYGQWVNQGQVVAYSGSTGRSTGPHLHIGMLLWGGLVNPFDYVHY